MFVVVTRSHTHLTLIQAHLEGTSQDLALGRFIGRCAARPRGVLYFLFTSACLLTICAPAPARVPLAGAALLGLGGLRGGEVIATVGSAACVPLFVCACPTHPLGWCQVGGRVEAVQRTCEPTSDSVFKCQPVSRIV